MGAANVLLGMGFLLHNSFGIRLHAAQTEGVNIIWFSHDESWVRLYSTPAPSLLKGGKAYPKLMWSLAQWGQGCKV